jgi:hypothetical protein
MWSVVRSVLLIVMALTGVFFVTMQAHVARITDVTSRDLAIHASACPEERVDRSSCLAALRDDTRSSITVVLVADEMRAMHGGLTTADIASLKDMWKARYDTEADGSLYALAANACANGLEDSCPRWLYVASWAHQRDIQDHVFSSMATR